MYNLTATLLVNFIIAIHVPNTETKETLYFEAIEEQKAVDSLVEILSERTLPLVLLINNAKTNFQYPKRVEKVFTDKGRIINGTQFATENKAEQFFFCPVRNLNNYCLGPTEFKALQPLECDEERFPRVKKQSHISCGENGIGILYILFYEICSEFQELKHLKKREVEIYEVCYDDVDGEIIFTHHLIGYPEILDSKALREEHNARYVMKTIYALYSSNVEQLSQAEIEEIVAPRQTEIQEPKKHSFPFLQKIVAPRRNENQEPKKQKHVYRLQKLTPPEDLTFALWRRAAYGYYNAALQHKELVPLWNEINNYIRNYAKEMYFEEGVKFAVSTGVFGSSSAPGADGQMPDVWAKLIYAKVDNNDNPISGLVILMNNFIENGAKPTTSLKSTENSITNYCKDDSCEFTLKKKFGQVGGRVRCCSVNKELNGLFRRWQRDETDSSNPDDIDIKLLRIPDINKFVEENILDGPMKFNEKKV